MRRLVLCCSGKGSDIVNIKTWIDLKLLTDFQLVAVLTDRGEECIIGSVARALGLEVMQVSKDTIEEQLRRLDPSIIVLSGFLTILPKSVTDNYKVINIHPSLLPSLPGKDPQKRALDEGLKETGVTIHWVDEGVDTGEIIIQQSHPILEEDTLGTLCGRLQILGSNLLLKVLTRI